MNNILDNLIANLNKYYNCKIHIAEKLNDNEYNQDNQIVDINTNFDYTFIIRDIGRDNVNENIKFGKKNLYTLKKEYGITVVAKCIDLSNLLNIINVKDVYILGVESDKNRIFKRETGGNYNNELQAYDIFIAIKYFTNNCKLCEKVGIV